MKDFDFKLNEQQYQKMHQEYKKMLNINTSNIYSLKNIIQKLQYNSFKLPTTLQHYILYKLSQAQELLQIITTSNNSIPTALNNNPFSLIHSLAKVSIQLTSHTIKSPYYTICSKINNIILSIICDISIYFENNLKY